MEDEKKSHLLVLDGKYIAYTALHTHRWLTLRGRPIGVVYGFWATLLRDLKRIEPTHLTVTWDAPHLFRKDIYPQYKENRKSPDMEAIKKDEGFYSQIEVLQSTLATCSIAQDEVDGLEADDLIALHCRRFDGRVTVHASDNDLHQLLDKARVRLFSKDKFFQELHLAEKHGCTPGEWLTVKALAGCDGDNVKGVKGIAAKTAVKIIKGEHKKRLDEFSDIISHNLNLVQLPYPLISHKNIQLSTTLVSSIDRQALVNQFVDLEFYSLIEKLEKQDLLRSHTPTAPRRRAPRNRTT